MLIILCLSSPPSLQTDYELVGPPQVVFSAGDDNHTTSFSINVTPDSLFELDETLSIILSTTDESVKIKHEKYEVVIINMDMNGM